MKNCICLYYWGRRSNRILRKRNKYSELWNTINSAFHPLTLYAILSFCAMRWTSINACLICIQYILGIPIPTCPCVYDHNIPLSHILHNVIQYLHWLRFKCVIHTVTAHPYYFGVLYKIWFNLIAKSGAFWCELTKITIAYQSYFSVIIPMYMQTGCTHRIYNHSVVNVCGISGELQVSNNENVFKRSSPWSGKIPRNTQIPDT